MTDNSTAPNSTLEGGMDNSAAQAAAALSEQTGNNNIDIVMDIPVTLSMELGRTRISIRELLQLKSGSVVELQKMSDEPLDVLVNGTLVARGEAVVVDDRFGVRLTDVISPMERVKKLR